jgi:hypothetical protein
MFCRYQYSKTSSVDLKRPHPGAEAYDYCAVVRAKRIRYLLVPSVLLEDPNSEVSFAGPEDFAPI